MPNLDSVRYLIKEKNTPLNIIVIGATHERYETALCSTENNFYSIYHGKSWNNEYGKIPTVYYAIKELPQFINYDLILCHTSCDRLDVAVGLKNYFGIPLVRMTHVLPDIRYNIEDQLNHFHRYDHEIDKDLYISKYNAECWKALSYEHINHGLDAHFWCPPINEYNRNKSCISVVNFWADRDWACGWNLWKDVVRRGIKYEVYGNNPGLSTPLGPRDLVQKYQSNTIYLNTSTHSPIPMAMLEGMSCGCVPVSTNNCMIPEIITHGENGFLANTAAELYEYCKMILHDPALAKLIGDAARKTIVDKFNINQFTTKWNNTFENLLI